MATWALRCEVLRPHRAPEEIALPDDDAPSTGSYAAVDPQGTVISTARVALSPVPPVLAGPKASERSWRLRGMATQEELRGRGIGAAVLGRAVAHVAAHGGGLLWCNARLPALPLYHRAGFVEVGEPWDDPEIGPARRHVAARPPASAPRRLRHEGGRHLVDRGQGGHQGERVGARTSAA